MFIEAYRSANTSLIGNSVMDEVSNAIYYEAYRIFRDRLINAEHKARLDEILATNISARINLKGKTRAVQG